MSHQSQLEKSKYRNWVRGGLAYKYLKDGIEGFADDVVKKEHTRIISFVNNASGNACYRCGIKTFKPSHKSVVDLTTGRKTCPWGQSYCNCLCPKKKPCPYKVCDVIMEKILESHGSTPPAPNWKNTEIQKWYTCPWEIAKCFINAPGYSDKTSAADIDINGLLHLFINNINLHKHLSCEMTGTNIFMKCRERRNKLFHSPEMELEDSELTECIDDIKAILEDPNTLAATVDAQTAVLKLKQLKEQDFIITTHNEAEVCRDAFNSATFELNQKIEEAKNELDRKHDGVSKTLDAKIKRDLENALEKNSEIQLLKKNVETLNQKIQCLQENTNQTQSQNYDKEKQELQDSLVNLYQRHYVKTSLSPLKLQENDINIDEVYVEPKMVVEADKQQTGDENSRFETRNQKDRVIHKYQDLFQSNGQENKAIYIVGDVGAGKSSFGKKIIQDWCKAVTEKPNKSVTTTTCETTDDRNTFRTFATTDKSKVLSAESGSAKYRNIEGLKKFDFLFFFSFQRMEGFNNITEMIKAVVKASGLTTSDDLIDRIFEQDSEYCLIVADGLDEWTSAKSVLPHVVSGLAERGKIKNATMVTFSRTSAKGILNLTKSECDLKVKMMGINRDNVGNLVEKYMSKLNNTNKSFNLFMSRIKPLNLKHIENSPLLLQQLVWLFCNGNEIGKSSCDVYCHIVNSMFRWSDNKAEVTEEEFKQTENAQQMQLPTPLREFASVNAKKVYVLKLGKIAFESLTAEMVSSIFYRSRLQNPETGFSNAAIDRLIKFGILVEENSYDPTQESTQLSFIHMSYLEFFAAIYVTCQFDNQPSDKSSVLKTIFRKCESAADILQISNLIKMICGLCPYLISEVSRFISDIVKKDESITRNSNPKHADSVYDPITAQIQELIFSCLSLCDTENKPMVHLSDVYIGGFTGLSALHSIIPNNVIYLNVLNFVEFEYLMSWVTQLKQLKYLHIFCCKIPHEQMTLLSSFIKETPLRRLSLEDVKCVQHEHRKHSVDLSKHKHLQTLSILDCQNMKISHIHTEHLETIKLDSSLTLDICLLQNATSLTELQLRPTMIHSVPFSGLIYNRQVDCVVHTLHQLHTLKLSHTLIDENALTVTREMENLKHIELDDVNMSMDTWRTFINSLPNLQQSVQVRLSHDPSGMDTRRKYVIEKENLFEVITFIPAYSYFWPATLHFRTRK